MADSKQRADDESLWRAPSQAELLAELTADSAELKEVPLRRDVRSLGMVLGRVLREQEGDALYAAVEKLRGLLIRGREAESAEHGDAARTSPETAPADAGMERAATIVAEADVEQAYALTKAFSIYFELTNLAETAHRARRRRAAEIHTERPPQPGTFHGTLLRLREAGLGLDDALARLAEVCVIPVFTAHPTEVSRRTVLFKRARIARALARLDRLPLTDAEAARQEEAIAAEVTALWQTDEVRRSRPSVVDEIQMGLDYYRRVLVETIPSLYAELADGVRATFGAAMAPSELPRVVRFGSWIGGDRDGNPYVTPDVTRAALQLARETILDRYVAALEQLVERLSVSTEQTPISRELEEALDPSTADPARAAVWDRAMDEMSADAYAFYRERVAENPDILPYFARATPVEELEHARIGSRPTRRGKTSGLGDLRAIPWVFGWMQSRHVLPAWFGVGHALERFAARGAEEAALLREMMETFPLFNDLMRNVEMGLAKADLSIARRYAGLVEDAALRDRVFGMIEDEFARTRDAVLGVTGQSRLLEENEVLARSIKLRNPYVDPLSLVQVDLLRRKRAGEESDALNYALAATINGISAGLRNTG